MYERLGEVASIQVILSVLALLGRDLGGGLLDSQLLADTILFCRTRFSFSITCKFM